MNPLHQPPFSLTSEEVVSRMLRRTLKGKSGHVRAIDSWSRPSEKGYNSDMDGQDFRLREEHAQPLVEAGLLYRTKSGSLYYGLTPKGIRMAIQAIGHVPLDVKSLVSWCLGTVLFGPSDAIEGRTAIPAIYTPGTSRLSLVLGENAAGKSLFRRIIHQVTHPGRESRGFGDSGVPRGDFPVGEMIHLSMEGRTNSEVMSSMVYGTEGWHSTGENSAHTLSGAFRTCTSRDHTTIVYWDEPDIGMSAGAAAGAGIAIREFIEAEENPLMEAVFLTTHSVPLVRQLAPLNPHYIFLGNADGPRTLADWFTWQMDPPPISIETLKTSARERFLDIQKVLDAQK